MANYSAADVKRLREQTGAGMLDCKNALVENEGDFDKAVEYLRVKGLKGVAKREGRNASNGLVAAYVEDGVGELVELNCETDFVAKSAPFQALADTVLAQIAAEVLGTDVRTATATVDQGLNQGQILLDFNGKGTREFADLTRRVQPRPEMGSAGCQPPTGCNAVAIVLDGVVQSAPAIQTPISDGQAQITVDVSQKEAKDLASILKYGPLPLAFETSQVVQMSPLPGKS